VSRSPSVTPRKKTVRIIYESRDQLVLDCPAVGGKLFGTVLCVVGAAGLLGFVLIGLAAVGIPIVRRPVGSTFDVAGGEAFLLVASLLFFLPGLRTLRRAQDAVYHFDRTTGRLTVEAGSRSDSYPLADVVSLQLIVDSDEGTEIFGASLILRTRLDPIPLTDLLSPGREDREAVVTRVNAFLACSRNFGR
jgi:hypothetical protein